MKLNRIGAAWDRTERTNLNDNWGLIENEFVKVMTNHQDALDYVSDRAYLQVVDAAKLDWREPVDAFEDLPGKAAEGETRMVRTTGKVYRYDGTNWREIQQIDAGPVNEVEKRFNQQLTDIALNIKNFGAKGDGQTDDSQALIDAIKRLVSVGGGRIFFPVTPNGYVINGVNISDSNIEIDFLGNRIYKKTGSGYSLNFGGSKSQKNISIKNVHFIGDNTVTANAALAFATDAAASQIDGVKLENIICDSFAQYGINVGSVSNLYFKDIRIINHGSINKDGTIGVGFIVYPKNEQSGIWGENLYSEINSNSTLTSASVKIQVIKDGFIKNVHMVNGTESSGSLEATNNVLYDGLIIEKRYTTAYPGLAISSNNNNYGILDRGYSIKNVKFIGEFSSAVSLSISKVRRCIFENFDMTRVTGGARVVCANNGGVDDSVFRNFKNSQIRLDLYTGTSSNGNEFENIDVGNGAFTLTGNNNKMTRIRGLNAGAFDVRGDDNTFNECENINSPSSSYILRGNRNRIIGGISENPTSRHVFIASGSDNKILNLKQIGTQIIEDSGTNTFYAVDKPNKKVYHGTAAPTSGTWQVGDIVYHNAPTLGRNVGWVCVSAGSPGTWQAFGQIGARTSIALAPDYIGQLAVAGNYAYIAFGTASTADWIQIGSKLAT